MTQIFQAETLILEIKILSSKGVKLKMNQLKIGTVK